MRGDTLRGDRFSEERSDERRIRLGEWRGERSLSRETDCDFFGSCFLREELERDLELLLLLEDLQ